MTEISTVLRSVKPNRILSLGIMGCLLFIIISSINHSLGYYIQPFFYLIFYWFYYNALNRHNFVFAIFLISVYIGECFLLTDVHNYFTIIIITFLIAEITLLYTFIPILKIRPRKLTREIVLQPIIGVVFSIYTVIYLVNLYYNSIPNKFLFVFGAIFLLVFLSICFLIPLRNGHPSNVYLYLIGSSFLIECILAFVYTYSVSIPVISTGLKIAICVNKICVVIYFVKLEKIRAARDYDDY